jgi:Flp pilus assembly protein protease CpaA
MYVTKNLLYLYWILLAISGLLNVALLFMRRKKISVIVKEIPTDLISKETSSKIEKENHKIMGFSKER